MSEKSKRLIIDYIGIAVGCVLTALGLSVFLIPNKIAAGGVSGLATVIYYLFEVKVSIVMLAINVPLFILGVKVLGKNLGARTLYGIGVLSLAIELTSGIPPLTDEVLLAAIYGGVLVGLGLGIVFKSKGTTGGTDLAAALLHRFVPTFSIGQGMLLVDILVVTMAGITFNAELALYAAISLFVTSKVIDLVQEGLNLAKAVFIISDKSEEIRKEILDDMNRGVTRLYASGGYTGKEKYVLLVILNRSEITTLKRLVYRIDPGSFVTITDVHEVLGEGFQRVELD